jgi:hypothetical protein
MSVVRLAVCDREASIMRSRLTRDRCAMEYTHTHTHTHTHDVNIGRNFVACIATHYGLDISGIESRWDRFSAPLPVPLWALMACSRVNYTIMVLTKTASMSWM